MSEIDCKLPDLGPTQDKTVAMARKRFLACVESGLIRHAVPKALGGYSTSYKALSECHQALGNTTRDPGLMLALNAHLWGAVFPILRFGNQQQKEQWIPGLLDGEWVGGHAITEPQAGSDIRAMETIVTETADNFILNGHKRYITNTPLAGVMIVYAKETGSSNISGFIITPEDSGANFQDGPTVQGCATATMGDINLTDCVIAKDRALGASGAGGTMIQLALEQERAFIFAGIAGVMQWQLEQTIQFTRNRHSGSGKLSEQQAIAHTIADMKLRVETVKLWVSRCADLLDVGKRITVESAQAKLYASEVFLQSSMDAAHIHGAKGLENEFSELVLDAMAGRLMSGSSEIQKNIIAAMLGIGPKK